MIDAGSLELEIRDELDQVAAWRTPFSAADIAKKITSLVVERLSQTSPIAQVDSSQKGTELRECQPAKEFAKELLQKIFDGGDPDGADIQETAIKHGLLEEVPFNPADHGTVAYALPGEPWFVFSEELNQ